MQQMVNSITALDASSVRPLWSIEGGGLTAPALTDHLIVTAATAGAALRCYSYTDLTTKPTLQWEVLMGDQVVESCVSLWSGRALVMCCDGFFYCVGK